MRYRLRTLLIVLALGPPVAALLWEGGSFVWEFVVLPWINFVDD